MKKINITLLFNFVWTLIIFACWNVSIETMSGGICNYWRCSSTLIHAIPILLLIQGIINVMMFVIFSEFFYGEDK